MANVTLQYDAKGIIPRVARSYTKKTMGQMAQPTAAASNHSGVLLAMGALEMAVARSWRKLDPTLRWLAIEVAAARIGCSWCVDYGYYEGMNQGVDPAKVRAARTWRDSDLFDDRERTVLEYAEAATATPVAISEDLVARLHRALQRRRDRRVGRLGGVGELPVSFQRRHGPAQRGLLGQVRDTSPGGRESSGCPDPRLRKTSPPSRSGDRCSSASPTACWAAPAMPKTWSKKPASDGCSGATTRWSQCGPTSSRFLRGCASISSRRPGRTRVTYTGPWLPEPVVDDDAACRSSRRTRCHWPSSSCWKNSPRPSGPHTCSTTSSATSSRKWRSPWVVPRPAAGSWRLGLASALRTGASASMLTDARAGR